MQNWHVVAGLLFIDSGNIIAACPHGNEVATSFGMLLLQTKARPGHQARPAKGVTQEEFIAFMTRASKKVYDMLLDSQHRQKWEDALGICPGDDHIRRQYQLTSAPKEGWCSGWEPIWSFDHPNIHGGRDGASVLEALGLNAADHFPLPANSCDLHKVIEHTHARLVGSFQRWLYADCQEYDMSTYKEKLKALFYTDASVAHSSVISADIATMPELCDQIVEVKGGWPPKAFR